MMATRFLSKSLLTFVLVLSGVSVFAADNPSGSATDLNTPRIFPRISSRAEWEQRANRIAEQIFVSSGLWPMPERGPLNARVFDKVQRSGYTVEKVWIETWPGFYLAGNLYRPLGKGKGPFPGVLNPHGHWKNGRMANEADGSIAARCITFARQGMVAFTYDMVGFNDTRFADAPPDKPFYEAHREFGAEKTDQLWNISLMGLQTWNSIRALDFLSGLPDVDKKRLACTGESGGGTQTFILGAIDPRLAAQAPVVMVSHSMQGGCSCENMPGLRVDHSNMEIAAAAAPRPQILVAASGDWTKDTMTIEGPSIARIYELLNARDKFHFVKFEAGHNYNQTSREAVYAWFGKWLLKQRDTVSYKEQPYQKEPDEALRVFPDKLPAGALTRAEMVASLKDSRRKQWQMLVPQSASGFKQYREIMVPAWRRTLQVGWPEHRGLVQSDQISGTADYVSAQLKIRRPGETATIEATYWAPADLLSKREPRLLVVCDSAMRNEGSGEGTAKPDAAVQRALKQGYAVVTVRRWSYEKDGQDQFANFFTTYNRTKVQERVRDILTLSGSVNDPRKRLPFKVVLLGKGHAGLWAMLAAPAADAVIADCMQLDSTDEQAYLDPNLFCPGLLALGGFEGVAALGAPRPLLLHNAGSKFRVSALATVFGAGKSPENLKMFKDPLSDEQALSWLSKLEL